MPSRQPLTPLGPEPPADPAVDLESVRRAAALLGGQIVETPCVRSRTLSELTGAEVTLKLENLQFTGSFKDRGALVRLAALSPAERARGVIAMSAGNHAQSVAYHAQRLAIPAVIVMPRFTPNVKVEHTHAFGAEVVLHGETLSEAAVHAQALAAARGLTFVHPYDDPLVIAGQGTIALEMLAAAPDLEALIVPVGGGGLIAGMAVAAKAMRPEIQVYGVQTARYPSMRAALRGEVAECGPYTTAEGIAVKEPGRNTLALIRRLVDDILLTDEADLEQAVLLLLEVEKTVAEGAGAAPLAALCRYPEHFAGRRVGLVISGGNIDLPVLSAVIQRGLVRSRRLARLTLELRDVPGELAKAAELLGQLGTNIVQVLHQRIFTELPLQTTEVQFVVQTRGPGHLHEVMAALGSAGYRARLDGGDG